MPVYKRPNSPYWAYDFRVKGKRFHGSTGCESKRQAEAYERRLRNERAEHGDAYIQQQSDTPPPDLTLNTAIDRWWTDKGERLDSAKDFERHLAMWITLLGKDIRMADIRESAIAVAVRKRRAMTHRKKPPSDATINRFVAALRGVWRYLDSDEAALPRIKWGKWITKETPEHPPEIDHAQLDKLDAAAEKRSERKVAPADWVQLMAELAYTYGVRAGELYFALDQFLPDTNQLHIHKKRRKKDVTLTIALLPHHTAAIAARWTRAKEAKLPHIWFDDFGGRLVPITRGRGDYQMREALDAAGLGRKIHRLRHHVGTELLHATGNLKLAQAALGHASIQSTVRYARVSESDLRAGFASISRNSPALKIKEKKKTNNN